MRRLFLLVALLPAGLVLSGSDEAAAGCRGCKYAGYYEQPVPVVRRPAVVLTPQYLTEYVPCGDGVLVNQGQYRTEASVIPQRRCFAADVPVSYRN
jgi:hypothetical protein